MQPHQNEKHVSVRCLTCGTIIIHDPQRITGCNCDPDAPHWVYINREGQPRGWSLAKWEHTNA